MRDFLQERADKGDWDDAMSVEEFERLQRKKAARTNAQSENPDAAASSSAPAAPSTEVGESGAIAPTPPESEVAHLDPAEQAAMKAALEFSEAEAAEQYQLQEVLRISAAEAADKKQGGRTRQD